MWFVALGLRLACSIGVDSFALGALAVLEELCIPSTLLLWAQHSGRLSPTLGTDAMQSQIVGTNAYGEVPGSPSRTESACVVPSRVTSPCST